MVTKLVPRTSFGLPRTQAHRTRMAMVVWAVAVLVLAGVALVLRGIRWADRNL